MNVLQAIEARERAATIVGFDEYEIGRDGSVWSLREWRGQRRRQLRPIAGRSGYLKVRLTEPDGRRVNRYVHRLVANAFLGPRPAGAQLRHLNGDKTDNRAANLAWGTALDNAKDRNTHGTTANGERNGQAHLTESSVLWARSAALGGVTQREIAERLGVDQRTISRAIRRETWAHV